MSIWKEQQKILNENLRKVKGRMEIDPGYVSKDIQEAIEQRENIKATLEDMSLFNQLKEKGYNPTMRIKKNLTTFTVCISVDKEYEVVGTSAINAAAKVEKLFWKDIEDRNAPVFNYNVYIKYPVNEDEEDYMHCGTFDTDEIDSANFNYD